MYVCMCLKILLTNMYVCMCFEHAYLRVCSGIRKFARVLANMCISMCVKMALLTIMCACMRLKGVRLNVFSRICVYLYVLKGCSRTIMYEYVSNMHVCICVKMLLLDEYKCMCVKNAAEGDLLEGLNPMHGALLYLVCIRM
jgi:hypothetical protein